MTEILKDDGNRALPFDEERLKKYIDDIAQEFPHLDTTNYVNNAIRTIKTKEKLEAEKITNLLVLNALDYIGVEEGEHPDWTYFAERIYLKSIYKKTSKVRVYDSSEKYGDFYSLLKTLGSKGIYSTALLRDYTKEEINLLGKEIVSDRDKKFTYIGLKTLTDRYLSKDQQGTLYELPQERFMVIAMELMRLEKHNRIHLVKEAYWAMSTLKMTTATPTFSNAGKSFSQLSSCFIDTPEDSLDGIYGTNNDIATLSKSAGGLGIYMGFIRSKGSSIKGFKGVSGGIVPWAKLYNQTLVSVDQLGQRNGSGALYLDVFHRDIFAFLDLRLNNGDDRLRAHDLLTAVVIPDLFMEIVEKRGEWALFDPWEVKTKKGWYLQDFYDEERGSGTFRDKYYELLNDPNITKEIVPAIEIFKRIMVSQLETGSPYMMYRDEVNRMNPNKNLGMIYSSNLCSEILQPQSSTKIIEQKLEDGKIVITKDPGLFVTCNLSSVTLWRALEEEGDCLDRLIPIQMRMLDNVIDLNEDRIEVKQAVETNRIMRAVGLGTSDWHHYLAMKGIKWDSQEAIDEADKVYERIAYLATKASMELAKEKGAFPAFQGSEWQTGKFFERRGYDSPEWLALKEQIKEHGIRNSHLQAVAPTGSTSILSGASAGVDPIYKRTYSEEKKNYKIPVTAPHLSSKNFWFYRNAFEVSQEFSILQNAARQKHIDQGISFNIYVKNDIKAKDLLDLHMLAWKSRLKTTYYTRSTNLDGINDCESCSS